MEEYELSDKDYQVIYDHAVREFNHNGIHYKQTYQNFLMRCTLKALLGFTQARGIEVRNGKLYVSKKDE